MGIPEGGFEVLAEAGWVTVIDARSGGCGFPCPDTDNRFAVAATLRDAGFKPHVSPGGGLYATRVG
ncbi:hypothetical protein MAUB_57830 [Mycolicibacterium aubagnense]|uniref:Uncharacterized protein n=1 Tax=Mycolicibacterium aubagnense TaxID=319707 RepID=A0ABN5Z183_9MYCO|nr:hypothetical protein [Mycolicibacterium aubagnense]TLH64266.1 hypothetical protein C1S80_12705 [Mycolicibacterium aubagnense]BBX87910.1 hypothetical protein MAUB_57830 [Mycolicibacterium aubagnense]